MAQIDEAMVAILADFGAVTKNRRNEQQGYNFRGIDDVCNELHPLLKKHGVYITTEVLDQKRELGKTKQGGDLHFSILTIKYLFHSKDGSVSAPIVTVGEGMDSGDKASNKAMSAALKYALIQAFAIPTEEAKDSENDSPPPARPAPPARPPQQRPPAARQTQKPRPAPPREPEPEPEPARLDWREVVTPQKKRMGDMSGVELATMETTLSQRDELTETAADYRLFALDGTRYYALQSSDMALVQAIANILDHDLRRPDEGEVLNAALDRIQQHEANKPKPNA